MLQREDWEVNAMPGWKRIYRLNMEKGLTDISRRAHENSSAGGRTCTKLRA